MAETTPQSHGGPECDNCGYCLRGLESSDRCPECGVSIDASGKRQLRCRRSLARWVLCSEFVIVLFAISAGMNDEMSGLLTLVSVVLSMAIFVALGRIAKSLRIDATAFMLYGIFSSTAVALCIRWHMPSYLVLRDPTIILGILGNAFCGMVSRILEWTGEFQVESRRLQKFAFIFPIGLVLLDAVMASDSETSALTAIASLAFLIFLVYVIFRFNRLRLTLMIELPEYTRPL
jgi:hypothetical protein